LLLLRFLIRRHQLRRGRLKVSLWIVAGEAKWDLVILSSTLVRVSTPMSKLSSAA